MAAAVRQSAKMTEANPGSPSGLTFTATFGLPVLAGSSIVAFYTANVATVPPFLSASDTVNGTWSNGQLAACVDATNATSDGATCLDGSAAGTPTVTVTLSSSLPYRSMVIAEISGTSGLDAGKLAALFQSSPGTSAGAINPGNVTPSTSGLLVGMAQDTGGNTVASAAGGMASFATHYVWEFGTSANFASKSVSSGVATTGAFTTTAAGEPYNSILMVFKDAGGGAAASDDPTSAAQRQVRANAIYRMSAENQATAQRKMREQKRAYAFGVCL